MVLTVVCCHVSRSLSALSITNTHDPHCYRFRHPQSIASTSHQQASLAAQAKAQEEASLQAAQLASQQEAEARRLRMEAEAKEVGTGRADVM